MLKYQRLLAYDWGNTHPAPLWLRLPSGFGVLIGYLGILLDLLKRCFVLFPNGEINYLYPIKMVDVSIWGWEINYFRILQVSIWFYMGNMNNSCCCGSANPGCFVSLNCDCVGMSMICCHPHGNSWLGKWWAKPWECWVPYCRINPMNDKNWYPLVI